MQQSNCSFQVWLSLGILFECKPFYHRRTDHICSQGFNVLVSINCMVFFSTVSSPKILYIVLV
jgi:hypothetical protein